MFRFTIRDVLWLTVGAAILLVSCEQANDGVEAVPPTIPAAALTSGECKIIGLLGRPYGEVVRIRGTWEENPPESFKDGAFVLRVTSIDGKALDTEHEIRILGMFVDYWSDAERPTEINAGDVYD